jgi:hypothetical protein
MALPWRGSCRRTQAVGCLAELWVIVSDWQERQEGRMQKAEIRIEVPDPTPIPDQYGRQTVALWKALLEIVLVFIVFFLHGAWPTPDVNETGYLAKASRFWNPQAFAGDFFCQTVDAHVVFYTVFGGLTKLGWSLDTVAWTGRIVTWLMLAVAWRGLSFAVLPRPWIAVLSAQLFVLLTEQAHMAGEWIVGGVEAKGFAWALVLWALTALVRGRWNLAWALVGAAAAFHVVVGGWAAVCLAMVWIVSPRERSALRDMLPGLAVALILAMPGLWFAWQLNQGADGQTVAEANRLQVFERLPHHLLPTAFAPGYVARHLLLWALLFLLCSQAPAALSGDRRLPRFVMASMSLAVVSFLLAWLAAVTPLTAAAFLRFYWSRLSDVVVPLGTVLVGLQFLLVPNHREVLSRRSVHWMLAGLIALSAYDLWNQVRHLPWLPESLGRVTPRGERFTGFPDKSAAYDDWRGMCRWITENTPPDAVFITPVRSSTFKWFADRGEIGTWKDMPQDAASILKWMERLNEVYATGLADPDRRWHLSLAAVGYDKLRELAAKYHAGYAIVELVEGVPQLTEQPIYRNGSYAIYEFDSTTESRGAAIK